MKRKKTYTIYVKGKTKRYHYTDRVKGHYRKINGKKVYVLPHNRKR